MQHRFNQVSFINNEFFKAIINHKEPIKQVTTYTAQTMKFFIKDFFRKSLIEIFTFCAVLH